VIRARARQSTSAVATPDRVPRAAARRRRHRLSSPSFAAYALVALVVALGRDTALEGSVSTAKVDGLIAPRPRALRFA